VILFACSTTWQFVMITPSERTTKPVPTPWPPPRVSNRSVVTFTTAGRTRFTTFSIGSRPAGNGASLNVEAGLDDAADDEDGDFDPTVNVHAVPRTASNVMGTSRRRMRDPPDVMVTRMIRVAAARGSRSRQALRDLSGCVDHERLPAGTSFFGSTNGIAAVVPVRGPFSDSTSSVIPGPASSVGTHT